MLRNKSRFGSKAARDESRSAEEREKNDPDGSALVGSDEGVIADETVDRYERSSDRYRAGANERASAGKPAPARSSFGRPKIAAKGSGGSFGSSFSKAGKSGDFKSGAKSGSKTGLGSVSNNENAEVGGTGPGFGSKSQSLSSKADAIKSAQAELDGAAQGEESVFERSSDRTFPKKSSSFGGGLSKRAVSEKPAGEDVYERSSDRGKFGKSKSATRSSPRASKSTQTVSGEDKFERSSDRNVGRVSARVAAKHAIHDQILQGAKAEAGRAEVVVAPHQRVGCATSGINEDKTAVEIESDTSQVGLTASERIEFARKVFEQALSQSNEPAISDSTISDPSAKPVKKNSAVADTRDPDSPGKPRGTIDSFDATNPCDEADPFESFEQCAPVEAPQQAESTYSRGTATRPARANNRSDRTDEAGESTSKRKRPPLSLRGRALGYLSRREHSRAELSKKLSRFLAEGDVLEPLLDKLEEEGWLSNERFAESVIHRRGARLGTSRIVHELKRNGIDSALVENANTELKKTELTRARDVWSRKFGGEIPATPQERARQARFLATRGFGSGTIMKVLNSADEDFFGE